jgi:hypothetical protein
MSKECALHLAHAVDFRAASALERTIHAINAREGSYFDDDGRFADLMDGVNMLRLMLQADRAGDAKTQVPRYDAAG